METMLLPRHACRNHRAMPVPRHDLEEVAFGDQKIYLYEVDFNIMNQ
jgi:hypothetical protein